MAMDIGQGGGSGVPGRRYKRVAQISQINVTPMVDVMLVLLVVFMITAPLLTVGVPIDLPKTAAGRIHRTVETGQRSEAVFSWQKRPG